MKDLKIIQTDAQKVFFTSDTHYGHNNICRGVSKWADLEENTRDFDTVSDMNDGIVNGINKNVREDDILFHLGDFALYNKKKNFEFRKQIKCKNVHLIKGNHDDEIKNNPKEFSELFSSIQNYK